MEKKKATDGHNASTLPLSDGHDVAPASQPVSAVTLPELRAMARLSRKADQQVAQLELADSSASTSDSDGDDSDLQSPLSTKAKIAHAHGGKSLKSGKEAKITSTVLYPQLLLSQHNSRSPRRQIRGAETRRILCRLWPDPLVPRFI